MNVPEHHEILNLAREQNIDFSRAQFSGVLECSTDEYTIADLVHAALKQWGNVAHCTKPTQSVQVVQGYLYDFVIDGVLVRDWFTSDYNEVLLSNGTNVRALVLASNKACEQLNQIIQKKATKKTQARHGDKHVANVD